MWQLEIDNRDKSKETRQKNYLPAMANAAIYHQIHCTLVLDSREQQGNVWLSRKVSKFISKLVMYAVGKKLFCKAKNLFR